MNDPDYIRVKILRTRHSQPDGGNGDEWQTFMVPRFRATRVLDAIEYIQDELEPNLGYRRHLCHNLVCRGCTLLVNGHARLACQTVIPREITEISLAPLLNYELIRDLIVDFQKPKKGDQAVKA